MQLEIPQIWHTYCIMKKIAREKFTYRGSIVLCKTLPDLYNLIIENPADQLMVLENDTDS